MRYSLFIIGFLSVSLVLFLGDCSYQMTNDESRIPNTCIIVFAFFTNLGVFY